MREGHDGAKGQVMDPAGARLRSAVRGAVATPWVARAGLAALSLAAGLLYVTSMVGEAPIDPTNVEWLKTDPAIHYLGWAFLRQDSVVRFPPTLTDQLGFPLTLSVTFMDLVPGLVIALRPLSGLLPEPFQYLGAFMWASAALLFYVGYKTARLRTESSLAGAAAATLFMTNSAFTLRLAGHAALGAQFLVAWAIYEYTKRLGQSASIRAASPKAGLSVLVLVAACTLAVNPYLCAMTLMVVVAYWVGATAADRRLLGITLLHVPFTAAALTAVALLCGYLGSGEALQGEGLGRYSANLNTFVNPLWFSSFFQGLPVAQLEQIEGSSYLGVSGLVLAATALAVGLRSPARQWVHAPLVVMALVAFLLSLSNRVTWGEATLVELPLGDLERLARILRSGGRLSWVALYVAYALGVTALCRLMGGRKAALALGVLALVQLVELAPLRRVVSEAHAGPAGRPSPLSEGSWRALAEGHRHLVVLPAWQCNPARSPGGQFAYITFGLLASRHGLTLNSYASGRYGAEPLRFHCETLPAELRRSGPSPDTLYVVDGEWLSWFLTRPSHRCQVLDGFNACARR